MIDICVSKQTHLRKTKHPVRLRFVQFLKTLAQARAIIQHKIVAMMSLQLRLPFLAFTKRLPVAPATNV
jgi:hypothetical protein